MINQKLAAAASLIALLLMTVVGQNSARKPASESFTFRRGQAVYIAAFHPIHNIALYPASSGAGYPFIDDLDLEGRLKKEFEKKLIFKVVSKLQ